MAASGFSRFTTIAMFTASLFAAGSLTPIVSHASGASAKPHAVYGHKRNRTNQRQRAIRNSNVRRLEATRSGVVLGGTTLRSRTYSTVNKRRKLIERRNRRVVLENHLQSSRRSNSVLANPHLNGVVIYGNTRETIVNGEAYSDAGTQIISGRNRNIECPSSHNCGYRVYENGSGPRIISPTISAGGDLPPFDGVSGSLIITLD